MITREQIPDVLGHTAYDPTHKKLGEVGQVFLDDETGEPEWITVRTGLFGRKESFVPIKPAELRDDEVLVPFQEDQVKDAPTVDVAEGHLSPEQEARLYDYYGMQYRPRGPEQAETDAPPMETAAPAEPATRPTGDAETDKAMTRSEEQLRVGKERREVGRARLRKYVVTDYETRTIPVEREEVRVEREPITEENRDRAMAGPEISEDEHEVVVHEERPVVEKETVPVERVRLDKETTTEEETVGRDVRKERIETEGMEGDGPQGQSRPGERSG
jgi:uncharacterized protein (TIGR02271 family)